MIIRIENKTENEVIVSNADAGVVLASIAIPVDGLTVLDTDNGIFTVARQLIRFELTDALANFIKCQSLGVTLDGVELDIASYRALIAGWTANLSLQEVGYFSGDSNVVVDMVANTLNVFNPFSGLWLETALTTSGRDYSTKEEPPIADVPEVIEEIVEPEV